MVMMLDIGCGYRVKAIPNCFQGLRVALATTKCEIYGTRRENLAPFLTLVHNISVVDKPES